MTIKILTHKKPYIIQVFRETTAIMIEDDDHEGMTMSAETEEDGTQVYSFGDWAKVKKYV